MAKPSAFFIGKLKVLKAAKEVQPRLPEVGEKRFGCKAKRSAHGFVIFDFSVDKYGTISRFDTFRDFRDFRGEKNSP